VEIKNGQSRETGKIGYTITQDEDKQNRKLKKNELTLYICNNFQVHTFDFSVNVRDVHPHPMPVQYMLQRNNKNQIQHTLIYSNGSPT
jgi:hypothetical protein